MYDHILVATDGSDHAVTAAEHAVDVAARYDATLHALYIIETRTAYDNAMLNPEEVRENLTEIGDEALAAVQQLAARQNLKINSTIEEGIPPERILTYIDQNEIDFVFMGQRGRSAFKTVLLGSTAEGVLFEVDVPVALV